MTLELITESALVDLIRDSWRMTKTKEFPIPGDYYYNQIDTGILQGKQIQIKSEHFSNELRDYIEKEDTKTVRYVLQRCIIEIFAEKYGTGLANNALKENRIRVRYD